MTVTPNIDVTIADIDSNTVGINIVNAGASSAENVEVIIDPRSAAVVAPSQIPFTCVEVAGVIGCSIEVLDPGELASLVVECISDENINCSALGISVNVGGVQVTSVDEPYILKIGEPPVAAPGSQVVYTVRVVNPLDEPVLDVRVTDRMPDAIEIIEGKAPEGILTISGQNILFQLDELEAGGSVAFALTTRVSPDEDFNQLVNSACLSIDSNPVQRCAKMTFLRAGQLPATGQVGLMLRVLRWLLILTISSAMLFGIWFLYRKLRRN